MINKLKLEKKVNKILIIFNIYSRKINKIIQRTAI